MLRIRIPSTAKAACRTHERVSYLRRHLAQVARIVDGGIPLRGHFVWSLIDNFEWPYGLQKRFGLIYVDFETGKRVPKASFDWYKDTITQHTVRCQPFRQLDESSSSPNTSSLSTDISSLGSTYAVANCDFATRGLTKYDFENA